MKYRIIYSKVDESFDIITEKGGVASFHYNGDNFVTSYFQKGLNECNPDNYLWDELSQGKVYFKDWEAEPTEEEAIEDALNWLVFPQPDEWEQDDSLYTDFFPTN